MSQRSRSWCFTLNNYLPEDEELLRNTKCNYIIFGREIGKEGTPHLQGYLELENGKTLETMKKVHPRIHWEKRWGKAAAAAEYCKKDGDYEEHGQQSAQGHRSDLSEVLGALSHIGLGASAEAYPEAYVRYHRGLESFQRLQMKHRTEMPQVVWLWGKSGSGKTWEAVHASESVFMKDGTKWWDGYEQQEVIVIDDFDGSWPFRDLLRLLDRYPYQGQTKGGYVKINSPKIYITCDKPPKSFWEGPELIQLVRRLERITQK